MISFFTENNNSSGVTSSSTSTTDNMLGFNQSTILSLQIEYYVFESNNNNNSFGTSSVGSNTSSGGSLGGSFTDNNSSTSSLGGSNSNSSNNNNTITNNSGTTNNNNNNTANPRDNFVHTSSSSNLSAFLASGSGGNGGVGSNNNSLRRGQIELLSVARVQEAIRLISDRFLKQTTETQFNPYNYKLYLRQQAPATTTTTIANTSSSTLSTLNSKSELYQLTDLNRTIQSYGINNNDILVIRMNKKTTMINHHHHHSGGSTQTTPTKKKDRFFRSIFSSSHSSRHSNTSNNNENTYATANTSNLKEDTNNHHHHHHTDPSFKLSISAQVPVIPLVLNTVEYLLNLFQQKDPVTAATEILASFQYYGNETDYGELLELHQNNSVEKSGYRNSKLLANFLLYLLQNICIVQSIFAKEIVNADDAEERIEQFDRLPVKNRVLFKHIMVLINTLSKNNDSLFESLASLIAPCIIDMPNSESSTMDRIDQSTFSYLINDKPMSKNDIAKRLELSKDLLANVLNYLALNKIGSRKKFKEETLIVTENVFCVDKPNFISTKVMQLGEFWITNYRMVFIAFPTNVINGSNGSSSNSGSARPSPPLSPTTSSSSMSSQSSISSLSGASQSPQVINTEIPVKMIYKWVQMSALQTTSAGNTTYEIFKLYLKDMRIKIIGFPTGSPHLAQFVTFLESLAVPSSQNLFALISTPKPTDQISHGFNEASLQSEFNRQSINWNKWRVTNVNNNFKICRHYPRHSIIPKSVNDHNLIVVSKYRNSRFPFLAWNHPTKHSTLSRASAPYFAMHSNQSENSCEQDIQLLAEINSDSKHPLLIVDTGSSASFVPPKCQLHNLYLPQVDSVREAYFKMLLLHEDLPNWSKWEQTIRMEWISQLTPIVSASNIIVNALENGQNVLIQNSSVDSDADVQLSSIVQMILDPHYRTLDGFQTLIEKEWLSYGHPFARRSGHDLMQRRRSTNATAILLQQNQQQQYYQQQIQQQQQQPLSPDHKSAAIGSAASTGPTSYTFSTSTGSSTAMLLGANSTSDEQEQFSPIFMQFIFIVWQMYKECPTAFQFNELYLTTLIDDVFSCRYGTFLCNNVEERESLIYGQTKCIWRSLQNNSFVNSLYSPNTSNGKLQLKFKYINTIWTSYLMRYNPNSMASEALFMKKMETIQHDSFMFADLSALGIYYIPESIQMEMSSLVELSLAHNLLCGLPKLVSLTSLEKLGLQGNRINSIADEEVVLNLPMSLKELNLQSNMLTDLPTSITKLIHLNTLNISSNNFKQLPSVLLENTYESLTSLNISNCRLLEVFNIPVALTKLNSFYATGLEKITILPEEIGRLSTLETLDLSENDFTTEGRLPWSITQLVNLKELSINHSKLATFPLQILNLINLRKLSLSNNQIIKLPNDITPLLNLVELNLSNNRLDNIPSSIGQLEKLQVLSIQHNQIRELRPSMGLLPLEHLAIQGNPLRTPPPEIVQKGTISILKFLKDLTKGQEECYRMKLMVVGQENVGKTTLIKVLRDKKKIKLLLTQPNVSTDGIIIDDWVLSGGQVKTKSKTTDHITLTTMDFAGQEVYYTTHQFFLSERSIYIIVWNTLKEEEHSRVEFWLQSITTRAPNSPIIIVGTHLDDLESKNSAKNIKKQMEEKYCKRFPTIKAIKIVSCTSGKGISSLRETIEQISSAQPNMGEILPSSYLLLENLVKEERRVRTIPTMSWSEFVQLGKLCTINDEDELVRATIFLNQIGSLVYFPNEEGLKKIVILDPQWITMMLASIITVKHNYTNQGVILHRDLKHIWKAPFYPQELHPHLLTLLEKFEISFNFSTKTSKGQLQDCLDENAKSLIPALLSNDCPPEFASLWMPIKSGLMAAIQYGRHYQFDFIPMGLFSRLMVRILNFASSEAICYWRNGILLQREGEQVLVELQENLKILRFTIRGTGKQSVALLSLDVIETITSLLQDSFKLNAKSITVPCVHCVEEGNEENPTHFTLQQCENAVLNNIPYLMCRDRVNVRTDNLVPDLSMATFSGTRITKEQLQFQKLIGEGGSALVYLGLYKGKTVAIKKLKVGEHTDDQLEDSEFLLSKAFTEFRRECWVLSGLDHHHNIVELMGLCLNPLAIVTEFLPDGNLHGYLRQQGAGKRLEWRLCIELALDIASGMEFLHSSSPPILHRDLKSPNILMTMDKEKGRILAKVADFGLSGLQHTIIERCVVNPVWLAPEIMSGAEATTKSDVYSFGVIMWEILTCQDFFGEISFMSVLEDTVIAGKRPPIPEWCHPTYSKLIEDCWNNEPKKRPAFAHVVSTLKQLLSNLNN